MYVSAQKHERRVVILACLGYVQYIAIVILFFFQMQTCFVCLHEDYRYILVCLSRFVTTSVRTFDITVIAVTRGLSVQPTIAPTSWVVSNHVFRLSVRVQPAVDA